jgi:hypothetical protein
LNEIKEKLLGKRVEASGAIVHNGGQLYFFPKQSQECTSLDRVYEWLRNPLQTTSNPENDHWKR